MGKRILPRRAPLGEYITVATRPDGRYLLTLRTGSGRIATRTTTATTAQAVTLLADWAVTYLAPVRLKPQQTELTQLCRAAGLTVEAL